MVRIIKEWNHTTRSKQQTNGGQRVQVTAVQVWNSLGQPSVRYMVHADEVREYNDKQDALDEGERLSKIRSRWNRK